MRQISSPIDQSTIDGLTAGELIALSGVVYTARDQAHQALVGFQHARLPLPVALEGQTLFYAGPAPARPGAATGAIGPTTSSRMDIFTPALLELGVKAMIGKGTRAPQITEAIKRARAVYLVATGGAAAYLAGFVKKSETVAFAELGPEAIYRLEVEEMPLVVAIDSQGRSCLWPDAS